MRRFLLLPLLAMSFSIFGQRTIAVQSNTDVSFYTDLFSAVEAAPNDATIHLPGGHFTLPLNYRIDKKIHLIGVGHHPDSTRATDATFFDGILKITTGMTGGSIVGIYITDRLEVFEDGNVLPDQVLLQRCNLNKVLVFSDNSPKRWNVSENFFRAPDQSSIDGPFQECRFANNVIYGHLTSVQSGCSFENNIFFFEEDLFTNSMNGITFSKNVFFSENINDQLNSGGPGSPRNFFFIENIFIIELDPFPILSHTGNDNLEDIGGTILIDANAASIYDNNYHLNPNNSELALAFDEDDNELIGLYNVDNPFKEGSLPANPHIKIKQISPVTDATGKLKVLIEVTSQGN